MIPDRPRVTADDWRALLWLIAFFVLFVAICSVDWSVAP